MGAGGKGNPYRYRFSEEAGEILLRELDNWPEEGRIIPLGKTLPKNVP